MATHHEQHDHHDVDALEYARTPEGAEHEYTDIEPSIAWKFAMWLTVAVLISSGIVYGTFWLFEDTQEQANREAQVFPLAAGQTKEPPTPRLQTQPFKDIYTLRTAEREKLANYGWVDKATGVVHIPIDEAMRLAAQRGMFTAAGQQGNGTQQVVSDSSAGRTSAAR